MGDPLDMSLPASPAPLRVLLVDDEPALRRLLCILLADHPDVVVSEAGSGEEAVRLAAATPFDLVVMDQNMPGMSGVQATREITGRSPHTTVISFTAVPGNEYEFADAGASGHFLKDRFSDLVAFVAQTAAARAGAPATTTA